MSNFSRGDIVLYTAAALPMKARVKTMHRDGSVSIVALHFVDPLGEPVGVNPINQLCRVRPETLRTISPYTFAKPETSEPAKVVLCELPPGNRNWSPDPFPGSARAIRAGCTCPAFQPWPGALRFALDCPLHELERVKQ